jgi:cytochrome c oxidase cbb3-type subunit III
MQIRRSRNGIVVILVVSVVSGGALALAQRQVLAQAAKAPAAKVPDAKAPAADGRKLFDARCAGCHGLDARGGEAPAIGPGTPAAARTDDRLQTIVRNGTPAGMPGFGALLSPPELMAVVQHLRTLQRADGGGDANGGGVGAGATAASALPGDATTGRTLFFGKAECATCHMARGEGGFLGSDLTGTRLDAKAVRDAILKPPASPKGVLTNVTLRDGRTLTGIARNEDNFSLQLQDSHGAFHLIDKAAATAITRNAQPLMPADYRQRLSDAEIDHLVKFVATMAAPPATPATSH